MVTGDGEHQRRDSHCVVLAVGHRRHQARDLRMDRCYFGYYYYYCWVLRSLVVLS